MTARPTDDLETVENGTQPVTFRGRRTRTALIQAAREVFEEVGFADARIADITKRADVSYGSFYTYFESKNVIFREVVNLATGEMFTSSRASIRRGLDPVERIRVTSADYLSAYANNARILAVIEQVSVSDPYFRQLLLEIRSLFVAPNVANITRLQEQGVTDPHLDPQVAASALGGMVENFARTWFLLGEPHDSAETVVDTLTRLWAHAIGLKVQDWPA